MFPNKKTKLRTVDQFHVGIGRDRHQEAAATEMRMLLSQCHTVDTMSEGTSAEDENGRHKSDSSESRHQELLIMKRRSSSVVLQHYVVCVTSVVRGLIIETSLAPWLRAKINVKKKER